MLANFPSDVRTGRFGDDIHLPATAKLSLLEFVANELHAWRDHSDRAKDSAENRLTESLCDYLNSIAHKSGTWSHVQFRTETGDETRSGRTIDLSAKPLASALVIEGRRHSIFDTLLPIECKRLPTPNGSGRDEREYVFNKFSSTGGIQRFKEGNHGAAHDLAAMIGYVQVGDCGHWYSKVSTWIVDLCGSGQAGWASDDKLLKEWEDTRKRVAVFRSHHKRPHGMSRIELRHLWVEMS